MAARSLQKASTHQKVGHTGKGLWGHKGVQLPAYIQHVANDLMDEGKTESHAIEMAVGIIKNWAHGHPSGGEKSVKPKTVAAAQKALAEWNALKARYGGSSDGKKELTAVHATKVVELKSYSAKERQNLKKKGDALDLGQGEPSYPIADKKDWENAYKRYRSESAQNKYSSSQKSKIRNYLKREAKKLGIDIGDRELTSRPYTTVLLARNDAAAVRKKIANNETSKTEAGGSSGANAKRVRSQGTGMFVEKFPEKNIRGVMEKYEKRLGSMAVGSSFSIPHSKGGSVKKTEGGFEIHGPGGYFKKLTSVRRAANLVMQIGSERV